jgi:hypothetical protein
MGLRCKVQGAGAGASKGVGESEGPGAAVGQKAKLEPTERWKDYSGDVREVWRLRGLAVARFGGCEVWRLRGLAVARFGGCERKPRRGGGGAWAAGSEVPPRKRGPTRGCRCLERARASDRAA